MARILRHLASRGAGAAMLLLLILSYGICAGQPQTSSEAQKRNRQTQSEIQKTKSEISKNKAAVTDGLSRLATIEGEINDCRKTVSEMSAKVKALDSKIGALGSQISSDEAQLADMRNEYIKAVKKMRLAKKSHSSLAFIFSAKSFSQGVRRLRYIREFASWRDKQSQKITRRIDALKSRKAELDRARNDKDKALIASRQAQAQMEERHREQDKVVAQLKQHGAELQEYLKKKQREADELKSQISRLIAQEEEQARRAEEQARRAEEQARRAEEQARIEAAAKAEPLPATPPVKETPAQGAKKPKQKSPQDYAKARGRKPREIPGKKKKTESQQPAGETKEVKKPAVFADMKGKLPRPVDGSFKIILRFGNRQIPDLPNVKYDNPGIDAEVAEGSAAKAVFPGTVSGVYILSGYRNVVLVDHDGYYTVYGNITTPWVKAGDKVTTGQKLGTLTNDETQGNKTVIHFEVWRKKEKLDPEEWIK